MLAFTMPSRTRLARTHARVLESATGVACVALLCLVGAAPASALSFSFVDAEQTLGEGGQVFFDFIDIESSGIDLRVTARDLTSSDELGAPYPYLDGPLSGKPGGLGVCQALSCEGQPDDNIGLGGGLGEVVVLEFSAPITLEQVTFRNGQHELAFDGSTGIHVGAGNPTTAEGFSNVFAAAATLDPNLSGTRFSFVADESFVSGSTGDTHRLYLETLGFVPEPTTATLLGLGLLASTLPRRRSR